MTPPTESPGGPGSWRYPEFGPPVWVPTAASPPGGPGDAARYTDDDLAAFAGASLHVVRRLAAEVLTLRAQAAAAAPVLRAARKHAALHADGCPCETCAEERGTGLVRAIREYDAARADRARGGAEGGEGQGE